MNKRTKRGVEIAIGVGLLSLLVVAVAKAKGDDVPTGPCGEGMIPNPALARVSAQLAAAAAAHNMAEAARLQGVLASLSKCVPATCPDGHHRDEATGACVKNTPDDPDPGFDPFDPGSDDPLIFTPPVCPKDKHLDTKTLQCVDDDDIDPWIKDFPEGNSFYQMKGGDIMGWALSGRHNHAVTQNLLARELLLAAKLHGGMDGTQALAWATARRKNQTLTNELYNAIMCCAFNDYTGGTYGYCGDVAIEAGRCPASMRNHPGEHGRAIRPLQQHADNVLRLRAGLPAARVVAILTPAAKGNGKGVAVASANPGGKTSYPTLWMPGVDRERLWSSGGTELVFLPEQANPPEFVWARGILDLSGSTLTKYGCGYGEREV